MSTNYDLVVGLEIHAQLMTATKAFCTAATDFGEEENSQVGSVSGGLPGALPVLNNKAVELAVRAGLALNCSIQKHSVFSRKNYFYPDLPKGYQISQFDKPICGEGFIDIDLDKETKRIGIERIHMEEDAGKSMHLAATTLVNLNRSGVPLIEIVSKPDLRSSEEAVAYLKKIHSILVFANISDGNLEEGNFRCDVNVSVKPAGSEKLGTRTELKNINSFRFVEKAIEFEKLRQISVLESGGSVVQETRGWDSAASKTFSQRKKEEAHDYRYFPEPDMPPLIIEQSFIDHIKEHMPELPDEKKERFIREYSLTEYDAGQITSSTELAQYFEACVAEGAPAKLAANWILTELLREIKKIEDADIRQSPISAVQLAQLIHLIDKGTISGKIAKTVFEEMFTKGGDPQKIVEEKGLVQVSDTGAIDQWAQEVIDENPSVVEEYKGGRQKVFGFLVGAVMKKSKGKANPPMVSKALKKILDA